MAIKKNNTKALHHSKLKVEIENLSNAQLMELSHKLSVYLFWWMGDPTYEMLLSLRESFPLLEKVLDFDVLFKRLETLDATSDNPFGMHLQDFAPELKEIRKELVQYIHRIPQGIEKAENWLRPIAKESGADADIEAAVYFASRGDKSVIDTSALRDNWHADICTDIERGVPVGIVPQAVLARAKSGMISLYEAAAVLAFNEELPRFFRFRDEEENFIDAAMFRAVEWFDITGFEPWLKGRIDELSQGPKYGIDHVPGAFWLFFWCRSNLALRTAERHGLESWLWSLINGPVEREKPWRVFGAFRDDPRMVDFVSVAGIILFVWHRIVPTNMSERVLQSASDLLYQTQLRSGGWPNRSEEMKGCILSTCVAIHGLAAHRPPGWKEVAARGAKWLMEQQEPGGYWHISGGPSVMLTVLALDALELATGSQKATFMFTGTNAAASLQTSSLTGVDYIEPHHDFTKEPWFSPALPVYHSVDLARAHEVTTPRLSIVVATEVELRQTLRLLSPLPKRRRIWRVSNGHDVYYIGRFGCFEAVVTMSSMGAQGVTGATLSVDSIIREWKPTAVVMIGIAFGANRKKHRAGDVLVAEAVIPYELQRVGDEVIFRNPIPPSSGVLINRLRNALDWTFLRPDGSKCSRHFGPILSGEKLVDSQEFKDSLLKQYPNAIGGEMEGAGVCSAAQRAKKEWIIVKAVCDWADGKKNDDYHQVAAASAASLCHHIFSDPHALDGV